MESLYAITDSYAPLFVDLIPGAHMDTTPAHVPVMPDEIMSFLRVKREGLYVDATIGAGGHAGRILQAGGRVFGIDRDPEAVETAKANLEGFDKERIRVSHGDFRDLEAILAASGVQQIDGAIADLGVSSIQLCSPERGFSFQSDGPLDMRFDRTTGKTAADLIETAGEKDISSWLYEYGDERYARRIAREIVKARSQEAIKTTGQLRDIVLRALPEGSRRRQKIHPATRTFMAIRIALSGELEGLDRFIEAAALRLAGGGRLAVIAFHSKEDRIVKQEFNRLSGKCSCPRDLPECQCGARAVLRVLTRKPVRPTALEMEKNPRARSARLRVAECLGSNRHQ